MVKYVFQIVVTVFLMSAKTYASDDIMTNDQNNQNPGAIMKIEDNECYSKGGVGIIHKDLYIVVKTDKNELILANNKSWIGSSLKIRQVVFVWNDTVFSAGNVPKGFKMSDSVLISFEDDRVYFMNFKKNKGGYYIRSL